MKIEEELIERDRKKPGGEELYSFLTSLTDDRMTISFALNQLDTPEKKQKLIDYIKEYDIETDDDIEELVMCIEDGREPELIEE